jgi:hypothetical protein
MAGWWFTKERTKRKVMVELVGRSLALTLRVCLFKAVGTETFTWKMVLFGTLWLRFCTWGSIPAGQSSSWYVELVNPIAFQGVETSLLNLLSLFFVGMCIRYVYRTELRRPSAGEKPPNVLKHGDPNLLRPLVDEDASVFRSEGFVHAAIAPLIGIGIGVLLWHCSFKWMSAYLAISSIALFIDEANFYRAKARRTRLLDAQEEIATDEAERRKKRRDEQ